MTKEYYIKHKERILLLRKKNYALKKKDKIAYAKIYAKKHMVQVKNYKKTWRIKNPGYHTEYTKNRCKIDPEFKLLRSLRRRVAQALLNYKKSNSTMKLVGCTLPELKKYLEDKFRPGMTWDNHGEWHIDHIKPCISFDLNKESEQKLCFHYTNLQPLWAQDNLEKGSKLCL